MGVAVVMFLVCITFQFIVGIFSWHFFASTYIGQGWYISALTGANVSTANMTIPNPGTFSGFWTTIGATWDFLNALLAYQVPGYEVLSTIMWFVTAIEIIIILFAVIEAL